MVKKPFITLHSRQNCLYDYQHVKDSMATMIKSCVGVNITVRFFPKMTRLSMLHEKSTFELSIRLANAWNVMFYFFLFSFRSQVLATASNIGSFLHCLHFREHQGETQFTPWTLKWASMQRIWKQAIEDASEHNGEQIWMMCSELVMNDVLY